MIQSWKEVLPGDRYIVKSSGLLYFYDQKLITRLYQPLIGIEATSLYFTLWQEMDQYNSSADSMTHHHLMGWMNLSLDRILEARKKLEAVRLLRTLKKREHDPGFFSISSCCPRSLPIFFNDGLLNIFLYHQIGSRDYARLKETFSDNSPSFSGYEDVTVSFNDVFESVPAAKMIAGEEKKWVDRAEPLEPKLQPAFDFGMLGHYLSDAIVSKEALTPKVKEAIEKLAFVYKLDPFDMMSRAIQSACLHTGMIEIDDLRKEVRDYYRLESGWDTFPALSERTQPNVFREMLGKEPKTDEEKEIAWFEERSPYEVLETLADGAKPAAPDLRLVEGLIMDQKLNPGVVNVLIAFMMKMNDYKLNKSYVEKIAGQWARKGIKTVRDAMRITRDEYVMRSGSSSSPKVKKKESARRRRRPESHEEVLPKWMTKTDGEKEKKSAISEEERRPNEPSGWKII
ncbi:DnaD domain protein [Terrilactibacillus sp. S3-3]|nr:DnaD domain protein [Terrilactibacillus sp. S3-3]